MGSLDPESGQPLSIGMWFRPSDSSADDTFVHHWGDDASYREDIINIYQYGSFDKQGTIEFDPRRIYRPPKTCNHNGNYFGTTPVSTFSFKTLLTTSTTASLASSVALSAAPMATMAISAISAPSAISTSVAISATSSVPHGCAFATSSSTTSTSSSSSELTASSAAPTATSASATSASKASTPSTAPPPSEHKWTAAQADEFMGHVNAGSYGHTAVEKVAALVCGGVHPCAALETAAKGEIAAELARRSATASISAPTSAAIPAPAETTSAASTRTASTFSPPTLRENRAESTLARWAKRSPVDCYKRRRELCWGGERVSKVKLLSNTNASTSIPPPAPPPAAAPHATLVVSLAELPRLDGLIPRGDARHAIGAEQKERIARMSSATPAPPPATYALGPLVRTRKAQSKLRKERRQRVTAKQGVVDPISKTYTAYKSPRRPVAKRHVFFRVLPTLPSYVWKLSHRLWNKAIHALIGNTSSDSIIRKLFTQGMPVLKEGSLSPKAFLSFRIDLEGWAGAQGITPLIVGPLPAPPTIDPARPDLRQGYDDRVSQGMRYVCAAVQDTNLRASMASQSASQSGPACLKWLSREILQSQAEQPALQHIIDAQTERVDRWVQVDRSLSSSKGPLL